MILASANGLILVVRDPVGKGGSENSCSRSGGDCRASFSGSSLESKKEHPTCYHLLTLRFFCLRWLIHQSLVFSDNSSTMRSSEDCDSDITTAVDLSMNPLATALAGQGL